jgi:hypothetical protein
MSAVELKEVNNRFILDMDKSVVDIEALFAFLESLKVDSMAKEINFDDNILSFAKEMKTTWWEANKSRFIKS